MSDFIEFISTTKNVWAYWGFGFIGLFTTIYWTTLQEKRGPRFKDLYKLIGWMPFVLGVSALVDVSPLISLAIGMTPERIYKMVQSRGINISFGPNNEVMFGFKQTTNKETETPRPKLGNENKETNK